MIWWCRVGCLSNVGIIVHWRSLGHHRAFGNWLFSVSRREVIRSGLKISIYSPGLILSFRSVHFWLVINSSKGQNTLSIFVCSLGMFPLPVLLLLMFAVYIHTSCVPSVLRQATWKYTLTFRKREKYRHCLIIDNLIFCAPCKCSYYCCCRLAWKIMHTCIQTL